MQTIENKRRQDNHRTLLNSSMPFAPFLEIDLNDIKDNKQMISSTGFDFDVKKKLLLLSNLLGPHLKGKVQVLIHDSLKHS